MGADDLTQSQQKSAYFAMNDDYDPLVYENTPGNWVMIILAFICFYVFQALHWWANFELGVTMPETSSWYNVVIFLTSVFFIAIFICIGNNVNKYKITHEFYTEKISEITQKRDEAAARDEQRRKQQEKIAKTSS